MNDKLTIGNIQQLTDEATKEYTSRGLLPNVAGQQELKLIKMQEEISRLQGELERCKDALVVISEYWNRDNNESAMEDACWKVIELAEAALQETPNES